MSYHWVHPHLHRALDDPRKGQGVWTTAPIRAGTLLVMWGGRVLEGAEFRRLPPLQRRRSLQIEDDLFLVSGAEETGEFINHSCSPNAGLRGQIALEARVDLPPKTEVTFDYAMSDGSDYDEFPCACGAAECRGWVRGDDWQRAELQERYDGHFSSYLARRIAAAQLESGERVSS